MTDTAIYMYTPEIPGPRGVKGDTGDVTPEAEAARAAAEAAAADAAAAQELAAGSQAAAAASAAQALSARITAGAQLYDDLAALASTFSPGILAMVSGADGGSHVDPVTGATVNNPGVYARVAAPDAAWTRLGNLGSGVAAAPAAVIVGSNTTDYVTPEGDKAALDARFPGLSAAIISSALDILAGFTDAAGVATDLVVRRSDGQVPDWVMERWAGRLADHFVPPLDVAGAPDVLFALVDDDGVQTDLTIDKATGQFPDWVMERWAARLRHRLSIATLNQNDRYVRNGEVLPALTDMATMVGWGSSTMAGLASELALMAGDYGATYRDGGQAGELAAHICARMGSRPALLTVAGGTIPASGGVVVTSSNVPASAMMLAFTGTLAGVAGTLSSTDSEMTFTRTASGSEVAVAADTPFVSTLGTGRRGFVSLLSIGKNDLTGAGTADDVIDITDEAFDWLSPLVRRTLVLGQFVNGETPEVDAVRTKIDAVNAAQRARYGALYVDLHAFVTGPDIWTFTGLAPTSDDLEQQALGNKPQSVSTDPGHFNAPGYAAVRGYIQAHIDALGWY